MNDYPVWCWNKGGTSMTKIFSGAFLGQHDGMKLLGGHVAIALIEQESRQGQTLASRSKSHGAQAFDSVGVRSYCHTF